MRKGIIAGGNWIIDRVKMIERFPDEETLVSISSETRQNGGAPFNVLMDLARLGARFPLEGVGLIGGDEDGELIRRMCAENGIDDTAIRTVQGASTSYTDVMTVAKTGRRTFFHHHGSNAKLDIGDFDFTRTQAAHFHLGYLLLLQTLDEKDSEYGTKAARLLALASQAGLTTSFDVVSECSDRFASIVLPTLPHADVCFMNEIELGHTLGIELPARPSEDALHEATGKLLAEGLHEAAVIHTAEIAYVRTVDGQERYAECLRLADGQIKGTVGAGDAFAAGYLFARHEGYEIGECLRWAIAAGASCLLGEGASNGVLPIEEALALSN